MSNFLQTTIKIFQWRPEIVITLAITIVILLICLRLKGINSPKENPLVEWNDTDYENSILAALSETSRYDYSHLFETIDEINRMASRSKTYLDVQKIEAADSIQQKIRESSEQIEQRRRKLQRNKNFYYYIGLHYASFTLANSIKKEQEVLRSAFVNAKIESERLGTEIEKLNKAIPNARGQRRYEMMQQHKKMCVQHKRVCQLKGILGRRNAEYLAQVKEQNRITREYREYIVHNFGRRGVTWGQRLQRRKLDQIACRNEQCTF